MSRTLILAALVCAACHHEKKTTLPVASAPPPPAKTEAPVREVSAVSNNLAADSDLVKQCQLKFDNQQQAPKFDFDRAELTTGDRDVLQQIAQCVTAGPLKGRALQLVGRADPRGTEEYNLGLGDRRAHSVGEYLERLGVASAKIKSSTRGALDATGHDESSWQVDRRVDLELALD
jgi:peptidoglycan-associated lipoprotein